MYPKQKNQTYRCNGGINTKASLYITAENEFLNLQNVDFRLVGSLSSFAGSTAYTSVGSTSQITGIADYFTYFVGSAPATFNLVSASYTPVSADFYNLCNFYSGGFSTLISYLYPNNSIPMSFAYGTNLYAANGLDQLVWNGQTAWFYGLPKPYLAINSQTTGASNAAGLSGVIAVYWAFVRADGLYGPFSGTTISLAGATFVNHSTPQLNVNVNTGVSCGQFGISGVQVWATINGGAVYGYPGLLGASNVGVSIGVGFTAGWSASPVLPIDYQGTFLYGTGSNQGSDGGAIIQSSVKVPSILEYYANQLFMSGAPTPVTRVYYSNPGTPEQTAYTNFFDVNPNDSDPVSALKAYFTQLMIWKTSSTWVLSGSGPSTFVLSEVSPQYGCISARACCIWNQTCWFLDRKGICEFNGALVQPVSNKVQDIFDTMNVSAARTQAIMVHVKERNEVWTAIPTNGATFNNTIVVYDYLSQAWTKRTCPAGNMTALSLLVQGTNKQTVYYGNASGMVGTFGNSLMGDNGAAFTSVIKSRFIDDMGESVTKLYRRFYLDATIPPGQTYNVLVNFYQDTGATASYSATMSLSQFQSRLDFGIAAKSLSAEIIYSGASFLQINGFTIEYRFQRAV